MQQLCSAARYAEEDSSYPIVQVLPLRFFGHDSPLAKGFDRAIHASSLTQDGLAQTPPMGYNSWNDLECKPKEQKLIVPWSPTLDHRSSHMQ